ncbi:MAG: CHAT domain-containing protein [Coleofasciculaceae cyanobacterium SM2_1_6]|nr:CHAT domain-containing protein [Coleofasciculaceae cyanobacterium SM2_1_6]
MIPIIRSGTARSNLNIIAIIGDSTDINTGEDTTVIKSLPGVNQLQVLGEPSKDKVTEVLWNSENTDILFFAGHGKKEQDRGRICINKEETLGIEEVRSGLQKRIQEGLQLAIFNSCDGLELGEELADLSIPQAIVMKEAVPDDIAQRFLKDFLREFSQGVPLVQALRQTRNKLKDREYEYPYASWLPVLYCNPTEPLMQWSRPQPPLLQRYPWQTKLAVSFLLGLAVISNLGILSKPPTIPVDQLNVISPEIKTTKIYEEKSYGIKLEYPTTWVLQERFDSITGDVIKLFPADHPEVELILNVQDLSGLSLTLKDFRKKTMENLKKYSENFKLIKEVESTLARGKGYTLVYTSTRRGINYQATQIFSMKGNQGYVMTYLAPESAKSSFVQYESDVKKIMDSLVVD